MQWGSHNWPHQKKKQNSGCNCTNISNLPNLCILVFPLWKKKQKKKQWVQLDPLKNMWLRRGFLTNNFILYSIFHSVATILTSTSLPHSFYELFCCCELVISSFYRHIERRIVEWVPKYFKIFRTSKTRLKLHSFGQNCIFF